MIETTIKLFDLHTFQIFSNGYDWMSNEEASKIDNMLSTTNTLSILNDTSLWSRIGSRLFKMPYIDGVFVVPEYSDTLESDIKVQDNIGKIISTFGKKKIYSVELSDKPTIIIYNSSIEIDGTLDDVNIVNIIHNSIVLFLLNKIRMGK